MLATALLLSVCQWIEPKPSTTETGQEVSVEARHADGAPLSGLSVSMRGPDGSVEPIGRTDDAGVVRFVVERPGEFRVLARYEDVDLIAPLHVADAAPRVWIALISTPVGLWLLWRAVWRR